MGCGVSASDGDPCVRNDSASGVGVKASNLMGVQADSQSATRINAYSHFDRVNRNVLFCAQFMCIPTPIPILLKSMSKLESHTKLHH